MRRHKLGESLRRLFVSEFDHAGFDRQSDRLLRPGPLRTTNPLVTALYRPLRLCFLDGMLGGLWIDPLKDGRHLIVESEWQDEKKDSDGQL